MYTFEETEETTNKLDWLIKDENGKCVAWAYTEEAAERIVNALNALSA